MTFDHEKHAKRDHLIIGGKPYACRVPVVCWLDSKVDFKVGEGSRRRSPKIVPDLFVLHWTGGENDVETLVRVLDSRELGVEFAIDQDGVIWQFCDPLLVDTFDAGPVNKRSFGVEIVNYGFTGPGREEPPKRGASRGTYSTELHGHRRAFARFYPKQLGAALALLDCVTAAVPTIPRHVPIDSAGALKARMLTPTELGAFKGVIGHFHVTDGKQDPGTEIFDHLMANRYR